MYKELGLESLKGRHQYEDLGVDGKIILKLMFGKRGWGYGLDSFGSG
jgi:hypothetical protein